MQKSPKSQLYGLMAEFEDPNALVAAAQHARLEGYRRMDAYSPFPIEELHEALGLPPTRLPLIVLIGGLVGAIAGYSLQYWVSVCRESVERRRQAAAQLARVHPDHVRDARSSSPRCRRCLACWP